MSQLILQFRIFNKNIKEINFRKEIIKNGKK